METCQARKTREAMPGRRTREAGCGVVGVAACEALVSTAMYLATTQVGLLAAELEARGFLAGVGKTILFVIIILVVIGGLIGFTVARRFGRRR